MTRLPIYLIAAFVLGTASGYFTYRAASVKSTVLMPALRGMSVEDATRAMGALGLGIRVLTEEHDSQVPKGLVAGQDTATGMKVSGYKNVGVTLSKGPSTLRMPIVKGELLAEAERLIADKGLTVSKVKHIHSSTIQKGRVLAQRPAPLENTGQPIVLFVSAGPYDIIYYSPSFEGMLRNDALALARELGLKAEFKGTGWIVETQWPAPGVAVKEGDKVILR